jgi:hypothetical protein
MRDYPDGANTPNWYWQELGDNEHIWLRRLMCGPPTVTERPGNPDLTSGL